jgi:hypothetical protein
VERLVVGWTMDLSGINGKEMQRKAESVQVEKWCLDIVMFLVANFNFFFPVP